MANMEETRKCPYCSEQILITAKKCKHCGEWLEEVNKREGTSWQEKGSSDARSVAKGLKEKENDDRMMGFFGLVALIAAVLIGSAVSSMFNSSKAGWIVGVLVFIIGAVLVGQWYYKE
jgi:uncharacterized membrane protein YvbJ